MCGQNIITRGHKIIMCGHEITSGHTFLSLGHKMIMCGHKLLIIAQYNKVCARGSNVLAKENECVGTS